MALDIKTYQSKSCVVEAVQITKENAGVVADWCGGVLVVGGVCFPRLVLVDTRNGEVRATVGDWIVRRVDADGTVEHYPCASEVFKERWEEVEPTTGPVCEARAAVKARETVERPATPPPKTGTLPVTADGAVIGIGATVWRATRSNLWVCVEGCEVDGIGGSTTGPSINGRGNAGRWDRANPSMWYSTPELALAAAMEDKSCANTNDD